MTCMSYKNNERGESMGKYNILKSYIVRAGYTQSGLASQIDMSRSSMTLKINNKSPFTADDMAKIRDVLSEKLGYTLTIDELFF